MARVREKTKLLSVRMSEVELANFQSHYKASGCPSVAVFIREYFINNKPIQKHIVAPEALKLACHISVLFKFLRAHCPDDKKSAVEDLAKTIEQELLPKIKSYKLSNEEVTGE